MRAVVRRFTGIGYSQSSVYSRARQMVNEASGRSHRLGCRLRAVVGFDSANRRPASIVQDDQPTSKPEANPVLGPPANAEPSSPSKAGAIAFDASAFEDAASQVRPSWEAASEPPPAGPETLASGTHPVAAPPAIAIAPNAPIATAVPGRELEDTAIVNIAANHNVVVPRPPRTPRVNYAAASEPADDFELAAAGIPTQSPRILWIAAIAVLAISGLGFALTRGGSHDPGTAPAAAVPRVEAPMSDKAAVAPEPAPRAAAVVPEAPAAARVPAAAARAPAAAARVPAPAARVPVVSAPAAKAREHDVRRSASAASQRESSTRESNSRESNSRESSARRTGKREAARTHVSVSERPISPKVVPSSKPKAERKGAGFVSTNPY